MVGLQHNGILWMPACEKVNDNANELQILIRRPVGI